VGEGRVAAVTKYTRSFRSGRCRTRDVKGGEIVGMKIVAAWQPVMIKGQPFSKRFAFTDEDGAPIPFTNFEIVVTPNTASPFTWNVANGQVSLISTGVYQLTVPDTETAAYLWDSGKYRLSVVDGSSNPIPCLIENVIFAKTC